MSSLDTSYPPPATNNEAPSASLLSPLLTQLRVIGALLMRGQLHHFDTIDEGCAFYQAHASEQ
jgi:hypothetical protein